MAAEPPKLYGLSSAELREVEELFRKAPSMPENTLVQDTKTHLLDSASLFGEPTEESLLAFIGVLATRPDILKSLSALEDKALPSDGVNWGRKFLLEWLKQFRRLVCEKSPEFTDAYNRLGSATQASILVLVPTLMKTLGITEPHAYALGVALFLGLSKVTKHAICTTLDAEVEVRLHKVGKGKS